MTTSSELAELQHAHDTLSIDFTAICNQLRHATDCLLQVNALLQDPVVAELLREREHEKWVLAELASH